MTTCPCGMIADVSIFLINDTHASAFLCNDCLDHSFFTPSMFKYLRDLPEGVCCKCERKLYKRVTFKQLSTSDTLDWCEDCWQENEGDGVLESARTKQGDKKG